MRTKKPVCSSRFGPAKLHLVTLFILLSPLSALGAELDGPGIVNRVNELLNPKSSWARAKMTIQTTSGQLRTFEYETFSKNRGEKNLLKYLAPRRVKGQATLMLNHADDIWVYFPRTRRVRKLATHAKKQKLEGSDFSYEDLGSGDAFITDFTAKRLGDERTKGHDCYKVELQRKKGSSSGYSRLVMWVMKENFVPIVIDYYDEKDPELRRKRLVQSDIKVIDGIPTPMKMTMHNYLDGTETRMEFLEVKYNLPLDDGMFTVRGLKR